MDGFEGLKPIGSGSFSTVFRARQPTLDRVVAIKVLKVHIADAASEAAFADECTATGRLSEHPNIVTMHGSGVAEDGRPFIVLAHYSGGSLAERTVGDRPLGLAEVLRIGVKVSSALHAAHVAGVLHCDVKPGNILMSRYGDPMLGDFGIASLRFAGSSADRLTPNFSAPEVLRGAPPTQASDTFALAATVYALLTGSSPFERLPEESIRAMGERIQSGGLPRIAHPEVDHEIAAVLLSGLHPDPGERVRSALDYGHALQGLQARLGTGVTELAGSPMAPGGWAAARRPVDADSTPSAAAPPSVDRLIDTAAERASMSLRAEAALVDLAASATLTAIGTVASQLMPNAPVPSLPGSAFAALTGLFTYHLLFAGLVGPTLGRWWADLTLLRRGVTGRLPIWVALVRGFVAIGSAAAFGAGYLAGLRSSRSTWPDEVSRVAVVRSPRSEPATWIAATTGVVAACSISTAVSAVFLFGTT